MTGALSAWELIHRDELAARFMAALIERSATTGYLPVPRYAASRAYDYAAAMILARRQAIAADLGDPAAPYEPQVDSLEPLSADSGLAEIA